MKLNKVLVLCVFFINYNTQFVASRTTIVFYDGTNLIFILIKIIFIWFFFFKSIELEIQNCDEFCTKNECYDIVDVSNLKMILDEEHSVKDGIESCWGIKESEVVIEADELGSETEETDDET